MCNRVFNDRKLFTKESQHKHSRRNSERAIGLRDVPRMSRSSHILMEIHAVLAYERENDTYLQHSLCVSFLPENCTLFAVPYMSILILCTPESFLPVILYVALQPLVSNEMKVFATKI